MEICPFSKKPCDKVKNVHINQNINGEITEWNCCLDCAEQVVPDISSFSVLPGLVMLPLILTSNVLLSNLQKLEIMKKNADACPEDDHCDNCGISLTEIQSIGRFGCGKCYESFKNQIEILLPRIQSNSNRHIGKKPNSNIEFMRSKMRKAINEECYEDAAKLRDSIKELEKGVQGHNIKAPD